MKSKPKIILASGSPRRKELLDTILNKYNANYEIIVSDIDEDIIKQKEKSPSELVKKLSYMKAKDIFNKLKDMYKELVVIGADTIVYFENKILGKPIDEKIAENMLKKLSGKQNEVYTGMTVFIKRNEKIDYINIFSSSTIYMKNMTIQDIKEYVNTKEPLDKAGAYAIQGIGNKYIEKYVGDFDTIVGLDTKKLEKILKEYKIV